MNPLCLLRFSFAFLVLASTVGCSSSQISQTSGSRVSTGAVSEVKIDLSAKADEDIKNDFQERSVSNAVRTALLAELRRHGKLTAQGATVDFTITECRLRSGSSVFWLGVSGGGDHIGGTVKVLRDGKVIKTFEVMANGHDSMWSGIATGRLMAEKRVELFSRLLAQDISSKL